MNREEFIKNVEDLGIKLSKNQIEQFDIYADFLLEYNTHTNLTAIKTKEEVYLKHFYDSLTLIKAINLNEVYTMLDVGTGAGFPGVVLKIAYPHLKVSLLDSNHKKIDFLNELISKLNILETEIIYERSENYAKEHLDSFDLVTARAVSAMPILTELCLPFVKVGGYFIPLKASVEEELSASKSILNTLHGKVEDCITFSLPMENAMRNLIKIKKEKETPLGYPRSYDKMKKALKKAQK